MGRNFEASRSAYALGVIGATLMLATSASIALALSESPAAGSSPAAANAPMSAMPAGEPATRIVPSDEGAPPAEAGAVARPTAPVKKPPVHHKAVVAASPEVEPANARLRVIHDGWIYSAPSKSSKTIERATIGKFVDVTGSTKYYLQAKLRSGRTGYIAPSNVELVKSIDKIFLLSHDAAVLEAPNRWAKKLAEVHHGHKVHVIGIALNYMRIRMKSGLTGFIPLTALQ
jgi:uncharacterized protein YgiM (DUF1202 family)